MNAVCLMIALVRLDSYAKRENQEEKNYGEQKWSINKEYDLQHSHNFPFRRQFCRYLPVGSLVGSHTSSQKSSQLIATLVALFVALEA